MATRRPRHERRSTTGVRGFTLVELVAVIVVVGVLAAMAGSRLMERSPFDATAFSDQSTALLRYAQKVAVAQNRNVYVRVGAPGIALCYSAACGAAERVLAPGGSNSNSGATRAACGDPSWACEAPPAQVTLSPATTFYFDALGKPFAAGDTPPVSVSTFAPLTITVRAGATTRTSTVEMETGYVH